MKPLILSFFVVLLGYSFFFDKENDMKLRNKDWVSSRPTGSALTERGDTVALYAKRIPDRSKYILRIPKTEDYLFTK